MYYEKQEKEKQDAYKNMLRIVGELSRLYSTSDSPFLYYRAHENIFARCFDMTNNARSDDSADAYGDGIGVGLKTWVGGNNQKVAEFGKLRPQYEGLHGMDLIQRIAEYRNLRIRTTMRMHGIQQMLYHIVKRIPGAMVIYEAAFDPIDIDAITIDEREGRRTACTSATEGIRTTSACRRTPSTWSSPTWKNWMSSRWKSWMIRSRSLRTHSQKAHSQRRRIRNSCA